MIIQVQSDFNINELVSPRREPRIIIAVCSSPRYYELDPTYSRGVNTSSSTEA